ncbi:putative benzoate-degrading protein BamB [Desulfosarcina cetonica]|uniref:aldehyde ferredoxin oxidoreductase N-terminal domain-containing protein n=1 Tax=Desulfosarcina cetonica TaxID=90730 RepID=UPI0006D173BD|nr:aldehyde ferredoxin oxidoreductase N-terminal domain-containing protein [Desulfosarcina cetonica]VTR63838.1 putative benzoate-degrading protein BamB [Desulfosarcina cetonica]
MRYGATGVNLEIDLSRGNIEKVETDPKMTELFLGGQGAGAKILWDRVPPDTDPFSPENLLIFSAGLLHATPVPGANRVAVNTFSPQTNLMSHSLMGGFFGPEMKHAGYDQIIIRGKASDLVYLYIHNDTVEIRDATHLRGKGCTETGDLLKEELKDDKVQVAAIGLAGENRVYTASIDHGHSSAARGVGVIMGDKRLKAIAVRGTKDINIAHPAELFDISMKMHKRISESEGCGDWMAYDEDDSFHHNHFAWGNARVRRIDFWSDELQERWTKLKYDHMDRQTSCYNCPKNCRNVIKWPGRRRFGYKCYGKDTYHMAAFKELDFSYDILGVAQEYGLDSYSTPQVIAFGIELYDAGILTDKDMPDFPEDSGDRVWYLMEKIVRREGIGDILADGVSLAAKRIGNGAEQYDHNTVKGFEQLPIKLGKVNPAYFLMIATGEKMSITQIEGSFPQDPIRDMKERQAFVDKWDAVPDQKFKDYFMNWEKRNLMPTQAFCDIVDWNEAMHYIDDSIGLCGFVSSFRGQFGGDIAYHINNIPEFIALATGMEMDKSILWKDFQRIRNLVRAVNVRRGLRRKDERPPEDHWAVRDEEMEQNLLTEYYKFKGWNDQGVPTQETLKSLDLEFIAEDLVERGILDENGNTPVENEPAVIEKN